jgi:hypothetical protein
MSGDNVFGLLDYRHDVVFYRGTKQGFLIVEIQVKGALGYTPPSLPRHPVGVAAKPFSTKKPSAAAISSAGRASLRRRWVRGAIFMAGDNN